jgi:putative FmdB family regulatory protein
MPTYEYACQSCGAHVDVFQRFSAEPLTECGVCGGPLRKVFHPAGILFKGSGFYVNDSRSGRRKGTSDERKAGSKEEAAKPTVGKSDAAGGGSGSGSTAPEGPSRSGSAPGAGSTKERSA